MPTTTQPSMTRLKVNEAWYEALFAPRCSHRTPQPPTWSQRPSAAPCGSSASVAAPAGWHRSSATTPTRPAAGAT